MALGLHRRDFHDRERGPSLPDCRLRRDVRRTDHILRANPRRWRVRDRRDQLHRLRRRCVQQGRQSATLSPGRVLGSERRGTTWDPGADGDVNALAITPNGQKVVVGGNFATLGGASFLGLGAVDPASGTAVTWNVANKVKNTAPNAAILTLSTDADGNVYGAGYKFGASGNLEGSFSANQDNGDLNWIEDGA